MLQNSPEENLIRNYLLGQLSENDKDVVEERLLSDPEFFEVSLIIEDELLEEYVMESLSESDRMRLESGLLTGAKQQRKVQLIRLLYFKFNASRFADEGWTDLLSRLNRYFNFSRSNVALAVCMA